jgi:hypothetical protein
MAANVYTVNNGMGGLYSGAGVSSGDTLMGPASR